MHNGTHIATYLQDEPGAQSEVIVTLQC